MKDLSSRWAVAILLAPVLLILGLALMGNSNQASAAKTPGNKAVVAIAFVSSFTNSPTAGSFQRITLNVISVRLNPSSHSDVSDFDSRWVTIGVPAGVGRSFGVAEVSTGSTFGGSFGGGTGSVSIGEGRSEIQIDLGAIQSVAQIFNAQAVAAQTYHQVELVLDPVTPGNVVPLCPQLFPAGEGCIDYRAKFVPVTPSTQTVRTSATIDLSKGQNVVTPLVISVDPGLQAPPTSFNQSVLISPTISVTPNTTTVPPFTNPMLGSIQGTVMTNAASGFSGKRPESITARLAGTNNIVITQKLPKSCNGKTTCEFIMYLPAAAAIAMGAGAPGGTDYDLVASGKNTAYAVRSSVNVISGLNTDLRSTPFVVKSKHTDALGGKVADLCTGVGVQAATLNLLVPDAMVSPAPDCSANPPTGCVVAASASTDEVGTFPLPGNGFNTPPFNVVPLPDVSTPYELVTTAAGFDRTPVMVTASASLFKCPTKSACKVNLSHSVVTGSVSLGTGSGPVSVLVAAEDSGTNIIENLALVTIPSGANSVPYTMNVPDDVAQLDFFASTQDLFNGAPQKSTGHTIAVFSPFSAPSACPSPSPVPGPDLSGMTCVGHGSATGQVTNPVSTDTVVLSKDGVQIESVPIVPQGSVNAGNYSLCAPADSYTLDHIQGGASVGSVPAALSTPIMVPTSTPCPGICQINPPNANTGCLTCTGTSVTGP